MLINLLTDAVTNMDIFRSDIEHIYLLKEGDKFIATGNSPLMTLLYRVVPNEDVSGELEAPACLGAVGYLKSLLGSAHMQNGHLELDYQEQNGEKTYMRSIRFRSPNLDANFECTNPMLHEKTRVTKFPNFNDAIVFPFNKEMRKEFDEAARMNTPNSDDKFFMLVFDGVYVRAVFGQGKHTTSLIMTDKVSGNKETKIQKLVSLDRFRYMIRLASENTGQASFHDKCFWVNFQTPHAFHTIAIPTKRDQPK